MLDTDGCRDGQALSPSCPALVITRPRGGVEFIRECVGERQASASPPRSTPPIGYPLIVRPLADIARLEEHRCALGTSEVAIESMPIAGGIASRGAPKSWVNTAVGLGLSGPVSAAEVAALVDWYRSAGHEPQVELCPYADPSLWNELNAAGFRIARFEQVMYRELTRDELARGPHPLPPGIEIAAIAPSDAPAIREAAEVIAAAFTREGSQVAESDIALFERCARHARSSLIVARALLPGSARARCVGAGFLETLGDVAALYGLGVASEWRGRGIQQALIAARINIAKQRGCTLATISGPPAMGTERNVRRFGFAVAYTRIIMKRPTDVPAGDC